MRYTFPHFSLRKRSHRVVLNYPDQKIGWFIEYVRVHDHFYILERLDPTTEDNLISYKNDDVSNLSIFEVCSLLSFEMYATVG